MWVAQLEVHNLRNLREVEVQLEPGLNIFYGRNAQGKTSLLEAVGLVARARSFRTEETRGIIRRGAAFAEARANIEDGDRRNRLSVRIGENGRQLTVDGRDVAPREYYGRLEVAVYSTERLRVIRGGKRERRQFIDRAAGALWPAYRQVARDFDRALRQRNAALESGSPDSGSWTDRFIELGATLRQRRSDYVRRLAGRLSAGYRPARESYLVSVEPELGEAAEDRHRERLATEIERLAARERAARRSLAGPHRDGISFSVDGEDIASASAGQARSLLLALDPRQPRHLPTRRPEPLCGGAPGRSRLRAGSGAERDSRPVHRGRASRAQTLVTTCPPRLGGPAWPGPDSTRAAVPGVSGRPEGAT